jgi:hypothetical protein
MCCVEVIEIKFWEVNTQPLSRPCPKDLDMKNERKVKSAVNTKMRALVTFDFNFNLMELCFWHHYTV